MKVRMVTRGFIDLTDEAEITIEFEIKFGDDGDLVVEVVEAYINPDCRAYAERYRDDILKAARERYAAAEENTKFGV